jgi:hypothetical protein
MSRAKFTEQGAAERERVEMVGLQRIIGSRQAAADGAMSRSCQEPSSGRAVMRIDVGVGPLAGLARLLERCPTATVARFADAKGSPL